MFHTRSSGTSFAINLETVGVLTEIVNILNPNAGSGELTLQPVTKCSVISPSTCRGCRTI